MVKHCPKILASEEEATTITVEKLKLSVVRISGNNLGCVHS